MNQPLTLNDDMVVTWEDLCSLETSGCDKRSLFDLSIIHYQDKYGLVQMDNKELCDDFTLLIPWEYDALFLLHHAWNDSYFAGYQDGKCALFRIVAQPMDEYGLENTTFSIPLTKAEFDSIAWDGNYLIFLYAGKKRCEYHLRTHTLSELYDY